MTKLTSDKNAGQVQSGDRAEKVKTAERVETERAETKPSRRERKKQRTRQAMIDTAFQLFSVRGFDAVTVEDITDATDVSPSTFFRYFMTKEQVLFENAGRLRRHFLTRFRSLLETEPLWPSLVTLGDDIGGFCDADPERVRAHHKILESSPDLMSKQLLGEQRAMRDVTSVIHEYLDLPVTDLRPMVVTNASYGAHQTALYLWNLAGGEGSVKVLISEAYALAEPTESLASLNRLERAAANG